MGHQGYDAVTVDLQHGMIDFASALSMLQALSATPAVPLVRVADNDPAQIMRVLDAGAYGVICPMISSAEQARRFVAACRYPPLGFAPLVRPEVCSMAAVIIRSTPTTKS